MRGFDPSPSIKKTEPGDRYLAGLGSNPNRPAGRAVLTEASRDQDARIRLKAIRLLCTINPNQPSVKEVLGILAKASEDPEAEIREAASKGKSSLGKSASHPDAK